MKNQLKYQSGMPVPKKVLRELVTDIKRGLSSYYLQGIGERMHLINIRDISNGIVHIDTVSRVPVKETPALLKTRISPGDVILTVKGSAFKAAVAGPDVRDYLFSSNLLAFSLNGDILPELVVAYLNSPEGQAQLKSRASGIAIRFINEKILLELPIPVPPKEKQKQLADFLCLVKEYDELVRRESELRRQITDNVVQELMG